MEALLYQESILGVNVVCVNVGGTTLSTLIVRRLVMPKINFKRVSRKIITLVD